MLLWSCPRMSVERRFQTPKATTMMTTTMTTGELSEHRWSLSYSCLIATLISKVGSRRAIKIRGYGDSFLSGLRWPALGGSMHISISTFTKLDLSD